MRKPKGRRKGNRRGRWGPWAGSWRKGCWGTAGARVAGEGKRAPSVIRHTCESITVEPTALFANYLHPANKTKPPAM